MKLLPSWLALAVFALPPDGALALQDTGPKVGFEVGAYLPDLELPTIDGESTIRLSALRGKKLLLVQFASW